MRTIRKIKNMFVIALNSIFFSMVISIMIIFMNIVGFCLIELNIGQIYKTSYRIIGSNKLVDGKKDNLSIIRIDSIDDGSGKVDANIRLLMEDINDRYDFLCTCVSDTSISLNTKDGTADLIKYLKDIEVDMLARPNHVYMPSVSIKPELLDACNFDLEWGDREEFIIKEDVIPIIIGNDLDKFYDYGDEIEDVHGRKYKVVGCSKKDLRFFNSDVLFGDKYSVDLNECSIMAKEPDVAYRYLILYGRKLNNKDKAGITALANSKNLTVKVESIDYFIKDYTKSFFEANKSIFVMTFFFIIVGIIGISSASCVAILMRKKDYGILYANGFSRKDICAIIYIENFIKLLVAGIVSYTFLSLNYFKKTGLIFQMTDEKVVRALHYNYYPFILGALIVLISILTTILPIYFFRKQNIARMIGGSK